MNFQEVCHECIENKELIREYNRLTGNKLGVDNRVPIEKMIDAATGYQAEIDKKEIGLFVDFILKFIWLPLITCHAD